MLKAEKEKEKYFKLSSLPGNIEDATYIDLVVLVELYTNKKNMYFKDYIDSYWIFLNYLFKKKSIIEFLRNKIPNHPILIFFVRRIFVDPTRIFPTQINILHMSLAHYQIDKSCRFFLLFLGGVSEVN